LVEIKKQQSRKIIIGGTQIRTGDGGFAIHCLTTWPYRQSNIANCRFM
jgi:hypothetical protein